MSDEKQNGELAASNLVRDAVIYSPPAVWGAMFGPVGLVGGAVATGILLVMDKFDDGSPKRPEPSDPA